MMCPGDRCLLDELSTCHREAQTNVELEAATNAESVSLRLKHFGTISQRTYKRIPPVADHNVSENDVWTSESYVHHGHPLRRAPCVTRAYEAKHSTFGRLSLSGKRSGAAHLRR